MIPDDDARLPFPKARGAAHQLSARCQGHAAGDPGGELDEQKLAEIKRRLASAP